MKAYILISQVPFKFNLAILSGDSRRRLFLITKDFILAKMSSEEQITFEKTYTVTDFSQAGLRPLIAEIRSTMPSVPMQIVTHDELSIMVCANLNSEFELEGPTPAVMEHFTDKVKMKDVFQKSKVPTPIYMPFDKQQYKGKPTNYVAEIIKNIGFPMIAKPCNGTSSKGVEKLLTETDLKAWCERNKEQDLYEIEEFIDGKLYHCDAMVYDQKVLTTLVGEDAFPCADFTRGKPHGSIVLDENTKEFAELKRFSDDVMTCLREKLGMLPNGFFHLELFRTSGGKSFFLEIAARPAGSHIPTIYQQRYGLHIVETHYKLNMGIQVAVPTARGAFAAFLAYPKAAGTVSTTQKPSITSVYLQENYVRIGDACTATKDITLGQTSSCILFRHTDATILRKEFEQLKSFQPVVFAPKDVADIKVEEKDAYPTAHYIIARQFHGINWANFSSENYHLHAILTKETLERLRANGFDKFFKTFEVVTDFTHATLKPAVAKLMNGIQAKASEKTVAVKLVTNDEETMLPCAHVRHDLELVGDTPEMVQPFIDKLAMKAKLSRRSENLPKYMKFDYKECETDNDKYISKIISNIPLPIFVKPTDKAGAIGTATLHNKDELRKWCSQRKQGEELQFELDEFIIGTLYHCDSIVQDGKIVRVDVCINANPIADFLQGKMIGTMTLPHSHNDYKKLAAFSNAVLNEMVTPPNCMTHLEAFKRKDESIIFVEVAARAAGGMVPDIYKKFIGIDIRETHYRLQMGLDYKLPQEQNCYAAWVWFPIREGTVSALHTDQLSSRLKSKFEITCKVKANDTLTNPREMLDYAVAILLWHEDFSVLSNDFEILRSFVPFDVAPKSLSTATNVTTPITLSGFKGAIVNSGGNAPGTTPLAAHPVAAAALTPNPTNPAL